MNLEQLQKDSQDGLKKQQLLRRLAELAKRSYEIRNRDFNNWYKKYIDSLKSEFEELLKKYDFSQHTRGPKSCKYGLLDKWFEFTIDTDSCFSIRTNAHSIINHKDKTISFAFEIFDEAFPILQSNIIYNGHSIGSEYQDREFSFYENEIQLLEQDIEAMKQYLLTNAKQAKLVVTGSDDDFKVFYDKHFSSIKELIDLM